MANGHNFIVDFQFYRILKSPFLEKLAPGDGQALLAEIAVERKS